VKRILLGLLVGLAVAGATVHAADQVAFYQHITSLGSAPRARGTLHFIGATVADDSTNKRTTVTIDAPSTATVTGLTTALALKASTAQLAKPWWSPIDAVRSGRVAITMGSGALTVGSKVNFTQAGSVTGIRFWWGDATATVVTCRIYKASDGSQIKTVDVTVPTSSVGTYTGTFATPLTIDDTNLDLAYFVTVYDGHKYPYVAAGDWGTSPILPLPGTPGGGGAPTKFYAAPWEFVQLTDLFTSGNVGTGTAESNTLIVAAEPVFVY
jgi:hypothetical protein